MTSTLNNTEWAENITLDHKEQKTFSLRLSPKIPISSIDSMHETPPKNIIFDVNISLNQQQQQQNENGNVITQKNPNIDHKNDKIDENEEKQLNIHMTQQLLTTTPMYTNSQIYSSKNNTFKWKIPSNQKQRFTHCAVGQCLDSPIFSMNNNGEYEYKLVIYPNGTKSNTQCMVIFIECISLPVLISTFTLLFDINILHYFVSEMFVFGNNIKLSKPIIVPHANYANAELEIVFNIFILQAQFHSFQIQNKGIGFIASVAPFKPMKRFNVLWDIPPLCKDIMSQRFDIWFLRLRVDDSDNMVRLGLNLISFPSDICRIEVEYTLKCKAFDIIYEETTVFEYAEKCKCREWKDMNLFFAQIKDLKVVQFECDINILRQFDRRGNEVLNNYHFGVQLNENKEMNSKKQDIKEKEEKKKDDVIKEKEKETLLKYKQKWVETENKFQSLASKLAKLDTKMQKNKMGKKLDFKLKNFKKVQNLEYDEMEALEMWFNKQLRLPQYIKQFIENGWDDIETIKNGLKELHLKQMGVDKVGHRVKILQHIQILKKHTNK